MANEAPRLYDAGEKLGYFSQGLELYRKYFDEILEKMNLVDVIGQMGSSEQGCSILCGHPAFKAIKKEALSKDADPFVSKALGVMLIELVNHDKIAYSFAFFKDLKLRLEEFFVAGFGEELYSCFDMIRSFSKSVEGFNVVYQTKTILSKLCLCCHSKTEAVQRRALDAVLSLLSAEKKHLDASKKGKVVSLPQLNEDGRHVEHLLIYVGSPGLVNSYIDASDPTHLKDTMAFIIDNLMMPFVEVEVLLLNILSGTLCSPSKHPSRTHTQRLHQELEVARLPPRQARPRHRSLRRQDRVQASASAQDIALPGDGQRLVLRDVPQRVQDPRRAEAK